MPLGNWHHVLVRRSVFSWAPVAAAVKVTLWARPGAEDALIAYEDRVLSLVPGHGGRVL